MQEMFIARFLISGNMKMVLFAVQCYQMDIIMKILSFHFLLLHAMFSISGCLQEQECCITAAVTLYVLSCPSVVHTTQLRNPSMPILTRERLKFVQLARWS
jgi:hypothetical protein